MKKFNKHSLSITLAALLVLASIGIIPSADANSTEITPTNIISDSSSNIGSSDFSEIALTNELIPSDYEEYEEEPEQPEYTPDYFFEYYIEEIDGVECAKIIGLKRRMPEIKIPGIIENCPVVIDDKAFYDNDLITMVVIDRGVKVIGKSAFADCAELRFVYLPPTLEVVDASAFKGSPKCLFYDTDMIRYKVSMCTYAGIKLLVKSQAAEIVKKMDFCVDPSEPGIVQYRRLLEIAKYVHQFMYDGKFDGSGEAASVLNSYLGVCGGLSRAFYHIATAAGFPEENIFVVGDNTIHSWNYLKLDDHWYNVDVTNAVYFISDAKFNEQIEIPIYKAYNLYDKYIDTPDKFTWHLTNNVYTTTSETYTPLSYASTVEKFDVNRDNVIDVLDYDKYREIVEYGSDADTASYIAADINQDGRLNHIDNRAIYELVK